jgi:hypothetical protein
MVVHTSWYLRGREREEDLGVQGQHLGYIVSSTDEWLKKMH